MVCILLRWRNYGYRVRLLVKRRIDSHYGQELFILKFLFASRALQLDMDNTNEINHNIHLVNTCLSGNMYLLVHLSFNVIVPRFGVYLRYRWNRGTRCWFLQRWCQEVRGVFHVVGFCKGDVTRYEMFFASLALHMWWHRGKRCVSRCWLLQRWYHEAQFLIFFLVCFCTRKKMCFTLLAFALAVAPRLWVFFTLLTFV